MGKVHGSLARAGKVKSQTPKVRQNPFTRIRSTLTVFGLSRCYFSDSSFLAQRAVCLHKLMIRNDIGRAPREEEDSQGTSQEAHNLYPSIRQRHHDRRQEEGMLRIFDPTQLSNSAW